MTSRYPLLPLCHTASLSHYKCDFQPLWYRITEVIQWVRGYESTVGQYTSSVVLPRATYCKIDICEASNMRVWGVGNSTMPTPWWDDNSHQIIHEHDSLLWPDPYRDARMFCLWQSCRFKMHPRSNERYRQDKGRISEVTYSPTEE